ncbi:MAG: NAD-dependent epimerase/dehydratase family protein [Candidatus Kapaibacterium sp.]|jgi:dihydroflavonol-4-reductase
MLAVVTGGTGFIGSHLVDELLRRGFRVRCLLRASSNTRWLDDPRIELREVDFGSQESITEACAGADYIVHCAGVIAGHTLDDYMAGNKGMTETMLRAALIHAGTLKRFLHISSLTAVGPAISHTQPVSSRTLPKPITDYGRSKLAAETSVLQMSARIPVTIIRPPAVYGQRDESTLSLFRAIKFHLALLMGFSPKWISLIHVHDLVRGSVDAMLSDASIGNAYTLTGEGPHTWQQIFNEMKSAMNTWYVPVRLPHAVVLGLGFASGFLGRWQRKAPVFNYDKGLDFVQEAWVCSNEEALLHFQFQPQISLHDGLQQTAEWYRTRGWL